MEKPLNHNLFEGRKLVESAKKYKCIVQHGTTFGDDGNWPMKLHPAKTGLIYSGSPDAGLNSVAGPDSTNPMFGHDIPEERTTRQLGYPTIGTGFGTMEMDWQPSLPDGHCPWMILLIWPKSVFCVGGRFGYKDQAETAKHFIFTCKM